MLGIGFDGTANSCRIVRVCEEVNLSEPQKFEVEFTLWAHLLASNLSVSFSLHACQAMHFETRNPENLKQRIMTFYFKEFGVEEDSSSR